MSTMQANRTEFQQGALAGLVVGCRAKLSSLKPPPQIALLADGKRLHLQDGPIDLIVDADGGTAAVHAAYGAAIRRFAGLLDGLCGELRVLRSSAKPGGTSLTGDVALRMYHAVSPYAEDGFITPMAAVAGSVADAILAAMLDANGGQIQRAMVNNGGDIAIWLAPGETCTIGLVDRPDCPALFSKAVIGAADKIGGIATSGARGRSFSLGIADAVTVLADNAANADAAATVIANAVDLENHSGIVRVPACAIQPDSDLGHRLVTRHVPQLSEFEKDTALASGLKLAEQFVARGLIGAASLHLQGMTRFCRHGPLIKEQSHA